jgi:hypothetical protein
MSARLMALIIVTFALPQLADAVDSAPANTPPTNAAPVDPSKIEGAEVIKTGNVVTGLNFKDRKVLSEADYKGIRQLETLKTLGLGLGPDGASLKVLAGMPALENLTTNGMNMSDADIALYATFKNLHTLTIFHPNRQITGTGFAALASLPKLENMTIAGTPNFADPGMAAIAQLSHLNTLRMWHCAVTVEGIKSLGALKELKSLTLGQCSTPKSPPMLKDDVVEVLAGFTSLESLTLMSAQLSLPALSKLQGLPNLKRLTLTGIDIPASDIATLKQRLPKVQIAWTAATDTDKTWIAGTQGSHPAPSTVAAPPAPTH